MLFHEHMQIANPLYILLIEMLDYGAIQKIMNLEERETSVDFLWTNEWSMNQGRP